MRWSLLLAGALLLGPSCVVRRPVDCTLDEAGAALRARWPDLGAAWAEVGVRDGEGIWYYAHKRTSVDGIGVTLALVSSRPNPAVLWDPITDLHATDDPLQPTLLFFQMTEEEHLTWPLIGFGYHWHFQPCARPTMDCVDPDKYVIHEAGYHHVPFGDGGMTMATDDDLREDATSTSVDKEGCEPVYTEDLQIRYGRFRHGRSWVIHAWLSPDDGQTAIAVADPWERWRDAPDRLALDPGLFFEQTPEGCPCAGPPPARGCQ